MTQTLCLIDGSGYIYRAFYAVPSHMTRPRDQLPINAVYGFTSMMIQFLQKHTPDYLAVVFDAKRANFRNDIYSDYKATRRDVPEALIPQFPLIREAVKAFRIPGLELEGFEADVENGTTKFYLDGDGKLNVAIEEFVPAGGGSANVIIPAF